MRLWFSTFLLYSQVQDIAHCLTFYPKTKINRGTIRFPTSQRYNHVECNSDVGECELPDMTTMTNHEPESSTFPKRAMVLRNSRVTDTGGSTITLGDIMGPGNAGAVGPIFVSIGDSSKLQTFLEFNPLIPPEQIFVDDYDMTVYHSLGLQTLETMSSGKNSEGNGIAAKDAIRQLKAPNLGGWKGWWNYLSNSIQLAPIPENSKPNGIPPGVLMLGGTFVIDGDEVLFWYEDPLPGVEPNLNEVLNVL